MIDNYKMEELKSGLKDYVNSITKPDHRAGSNFYKCPLCNSGYGKNGNNTGAFSITSDGKKWKCFSCDQGGDIFDLIGLYEHKDSFAERASRAAEIVNTHISFKGKENKREAENLKKPEIKLYIEECKKNVGKTDYFKGRGFTDETIDKFNLGYDVNKKSIVIPYGQKGNYYTTRSTERHEFRKPKKSEAGEEPIYNVAALSQDKPCFVCEGPVDAISIMQASGGICTAIALGGTGNRKLIERVKKQPPKCILVLSFDNDEKKDGKEELPPGQRATEQTAKELTEMGIPFIKASYTLKAYPKDRQKDPNDYLVSNPSQLSADILRIVGEAQEVSNKVERLKDAKKVETLEAYKANNGAELIKDFLNGIKDKANTVYIPTGFSKLDQELDGGLYPGLYILGAISSLGKTTFMLQMADQIAAQGKTVFYYSLEMSADELISKSISRHTFNLCGGMTSNAKTNRGITTLSRYKDYSLQEKNLIGEAIEAYRAYASNLYIFEGIGNIGTLQIKEDIKKYYEATGEAPVIFIDYLQILAPSPEDMRATDKQITDKAVLELKRISRDFKTPVFAISSFNRDSYTNAVSMSAFKESGSVEYGSDVLMGLQPSGMMPGYNKKEQKENIELVQKCKTSKIRNIEAVILKNRNGKANGKILFTYYSLFNCIDQYDNIRQIEIPSDEVIKEMTGTTSKPIKSSGIRI